MMRAAVFLGEGRLEIQDRDLPEITRPNEVLVKVENAGICGSDLAILATPPRHDATPGTVLGHEIVGYLTAVGEGVAGFEIGDRVVVAPNVPCGRCTECRRGLTTHCTDMTIHGVYVDGGLAPYVVVPESACYPISTAVPREIAALAEPLSTVVRGVQRAQVFPGDTAAVIGGGPIGLMFCALLRASGATVIVVEPSDQRAALATAMGAAAVVKPESDELKKALADFTDGHGADVVVDAVGSQFSACLELARTAATIVLFGVNSTATSTVHQFDITHRELDIRGAMVGRDTFPLAIRILEQGAIDFSPLITHRVDLEALGDALERLRAGEAIKAQVEFP